MDPVFGYEDTLVRPSRSVELAPIKRVAIMVNSFFPKVDGEARLADLTLQYLQASGREILVVAPDIAPVHVGSRRDVHMSAFSLLGAPETRAALPSFSIKHALDHFQPDLIHLFSPAVLSAAGMWSGRSQHIPVVANYQIDCSTDTPAAEDWLRSIHNGCQLTLVPSQHTLNQLQAKNYERLRVWQRGIDQDSEPHSWPVIMAQLEKYYGEAVELNEHFYRARRPAIALRKMRWGRS